MHQNTVFLVIPPLFQSSCRFTAFQMENWSQNLQFCILFLHFAQIVALFADLRGFKAHRRPNMYISLKTHFSSPCMDLQCSKWKLPIKIDDFVFLTLILPNFCSFSSSKLKKLFFCHFY